MKKKGRKEEANNILYWMFLLYMIENSINKNYYMKKTGEVYSGQIFLNCGKITDRFGNELVFM